MNQNRMQPSHYITNLQRQSPEAHSKDLLTARALQRWENEGGRIPRKWERADDPETARRAMDSTTWRMKASNVDA